MPIEIEDMQTEMHIGTAPTLEGAAGSAGPGQPASSQVQARIALEGLVVEIVEDALDRMLREVD